VNSGIKDKEILITIPASNAGKFRFKKRKNKLDFGEIFSTRECCFDEQTYLEWQIGYDVPVKDVEEGVTKTKLNSNSFVGSNCKSKYPYELSEIFYAAMGLNLILKKEVQHLLDEISKYKSFIDEKVISVERHSKLNINGVNFEETSIKLPTFFMVETLDYTQIEASIQKQQYASGVQPMIYFCIPLNSFKNFSNFLGRSSVLGDELVYAISKSNAQNLINLMKIFGMASKRHNYDIVQIIQVLLKITG
jgi:hypothetical protein